MSEPPVKLSAEQLVSAIDEIERVVKAHSAALETATLRRTGAERRLRKHTRGAKGKRVLLPYTKYVAVFIAVGSFFTYFLFTPSLNEPSRVGSVTHATERELLGAPCSFAVEHILDNCRTQLVCASWEYDAMHPCHVDAVSRSTGEGGTTEDRYIVVSGPSVSRDGNIDEDEDSAPILSFDERDGQVLIRRRATEGSNAWSIQVLIHRF